MREAEKVPKNLPKRAQKQSQTQRLQKNEKTESEIFDDRSEGAVWPTERHPTSESEKETKEMFEKMSKISFHPLFRIGKQTQTYGEKRQNRLFAHEQTQQSKIEESNVSNQYERGSSAKRSADSTAFGKNEGLW